VASVILDTRGSAGLKVNVKVFAMVVKGRFVAKLPGARVDELFCRLLRRRAGEGLP
jgi:hypothetical protein